MEDFVKNLFGLGGGELDNSFENGGIGFFVNGKWIIYVLVVEVREWFFVSIYISVCWVIRLDVGLFFSFNFYYWFFCRFII